MCLRERAQDVSVNYIDAEKGLPILFEFAVGAIDRGCPLSFVSQFPGEDEILIPPFSYLKVTGAPFSMPPPSPSPNLVYGMPPPWDKRATISSLRASFLYVST